MFPPGFTPVKRLFNEHCCRSECLECDDDMSHVEFCLQIECDVDASLPIGSLPPGQVLLASRILRRLVLVNNFGHRVTVIVGITNVTFCVLLVTPPIQRGDYTVTFWSIHTTGIVGSQHVFPPDEQVAGGRVAGALITSHHVTSPRLLGLSGWSEGAYYVDQDDLPHLHLENLQIHHLTRVRLHYNHMALL